MIRLPLIAGFYGVLAAVAGIWSHLGAHPGLLVQGPGTLGPEAAAALGLGGGLAFVGLSVLLVGRVRWLRRLTVRMGELLGPLDGGTIFLLAGFSALGEELFFRGAMQSAWGLLPTALVFGLAHLGPERLFLPWTLVAGVLGLGLGLLTEVSGNLLGAVLAHFTINYFNLHLIDAWRRRVSAAGPAAGARPGGEAG
ncbi:MAG: CPBP family intramembrane glutamic endopeptidase [Myxococcota bacterium]|jgi:membrane protease YdiL (CAAX protease family)|nr:CPBP family intramembrane glutamic endopeptidase [Myxococcota bacterium]